MKVYDNVYSFERPKAVEFDEHHVYINSNIRVIELLGNPSLIGELGFDWNNVTTSMSELYAYTCTEYGKDEYIIATAQQLNGLSFRVDDGVLVVITPD